MINKLKNKIEEYDSIIILRHRQPDLDALGSQFGLAKTLKQHYPNKSIYVVGDMTERLRFIGEMDQVRDEVFQDSLAIVCDVAVSTMICDPRYTLAKEIFVIDHHKNSSDITENFIIDSTRASCADLVTEILLEHWGLSIPRDAATALFGGIVADSGRFQYPSTSPKTLRLAANLLELGADMNYIYTNLYVETLESKQMKAYFSNKFEVTKHKVAYLKNNQEVFEKYPVEFSTISRGMIGVMAGIEGINIWANFTYDIEKDAIIGEFRSRGVDIVDIAKEHGGGGHNQACGATLATWDEVDEIIIKFDERAKEYKDATTTR